MLIETKITLKKEDITNAIKEYLEKNVPECKGCSLNIDVEKIKEISISFIPITKDWGNVQELIPAKLNY
jgi:pimeloyl-CoA synthetase